MTREPLELTVQVETDGTYVGTARAALDALRREYRRLGLCPEPGDVLTWVLVDGRNPFGGAP